MSEIRAINNMADFRKLAAEVGVSVSEGPGRFPREAVQVAANKRGIYLNLANFKGGSAPAKKVNHVLVSAMVNGTPRRLVTTSQEVREAAGEDVSKRGATSLNHYAKFATSQWGAELSATDVIVVSVTADQAAQISAEESGETAAPAAETVAKPRKSTRKGKDTSKASADASEAVSPVAE